MSENGKVLTSVDADWGYGQEQFDPPVGIPMAGHSAAGMIGNLSVAEDPLNMRTLILNPGSAGDEVIICFMDLLSGSRALYERVQELLPTKQPNMALVGTHTHYAPGKYFGNPFYDSFAQKFAPDLPIAKPLQHVIDLFATAIVESIKKARDSIKSGKVAVIQSTFWENGVNRSYEAFKRNDIADTWNNAGMPGESAAPDLDELYKAIDPRVTTILAINNSATNLCSFSTVACHSTCMGPDLEKYSADWPGFAAKVVKDTLEGRHAPGAIVCNSAFAMCAAGDVSSLDLDRLKQVGSDPRGQGDALREKRGQKIGEHTAKVIQLRLNDVRHRPPETNPITFRSDEPLVEREKEFKPERKYGPPQPGWPLLAGVEDGGGIVHSDATEGGVGRDRRRGESRFQHPKRVVLGGLLSLFRLTDETLRVAERHPICQVRIGSHIFVSAPCELTTMAGFFLERAVVQHSDANSASIWVNTNDYMGYITTPQEYEAQLYEGGHTLFGRLSLVHLHDSHMRVLAESRSPRVPEPAPAPAATPAATPVVIDAATTGANAEEAPQLVDHTKFIEEQRSEILSELQEGYVVHVEPIGSPESDRSNSELDDELATELEEMEAVAKSWETKAERPRNLEELPLQAEDQEPRYEVQVLFRSESVRQKVYLRHQDEIHESIFIANFGDIGQEGKDIFAAVFELSGTPIAKEEFALVYDD